MYGVFKTFLTLINMLDHLPDVNAVCFECTLCMCNRKDFQLLQDLLTRKRNFTNEEGYWTRQKPSRRDKRASNHQRIRNTPKRIKRNAERPKCNENRNHQ